MKRDLQEKNMHEEYFSLSDEFILHKMREEALKDKLRKATRMVWVTFKHNIFKFRISIELLGVDEHTQFRDNITQWLREFAHNKELDFNDKTYEAISDELYVKINEKYPERTVWIDVSEYGENGALAYYDKSV